MTAEQQDALYAAAKARQDASAKAAEAAPAAAPHETQYIDPEKSMAAFNANRDLGIVGQAKKYGQAADDTIRQIAGSLGDVVAGAANSVISGGPMDENTLYEAAKTRMAAQRMDAQTPGASAAAGVVGDVGKVLALPGGMFATPIRAAATGAGLDVASTFFDRLEKGEPVNVDAQEYINNAAKGAGTGFLGYHIGKLVGNTISRFVGKDPSITKAAQDAVAANKKIADEGTQKMLSSNVAINPMGQNRLLRTIEKDLGKKYELSPQTTKEAWKALNILRNRVAQGAEISLDSFNALRSSVGRSLYSDSGLLKREVNTRDLAIVNDIYKAMTKFGDELPITRQFVRSGGNLKDGMQGWKQMTKFQQTQERTEKLTELLTNAEAKAAVAGKRSKSLEQAIQDEFSSMFTTQAGRDMAQRMFTPEQIKILRKIAKGDVSQKIFATLDNWLGASLISPIFRGIRSLHGAAFQAEESRYAAKKAISAVGETPLKQRIGPKWGVATVVESLKNR